MFHKLLTASLMIKLSSNTDEIKSFSWSLKRNKCTFETMTFTLATKKKDRETQLVQGQTL